MKQELEKLTKLRGEREIEMQLREQEQMRLRREQDRAALGDWEKREDEFHLGQAKTRAQIRIKEGRAKPIDILAINISLVTDNAIAKEFEGMGLEMDTEEPYHIFENLVYSEVEELHKDIQMYLELEKDEGNSAFWKSMLIVCDDELARHRKRANMRGRHDRSSAAADAVQEEITAMLSGKTYDQLKTIQAQVEKRLSGEDEYSGPIDVEYWEAVMKAAIVWRAKARLREMHKFLLSKRLEQLKARSAESASAVKESSASSSSSSDSAKKPAVKLGRSLLATFSTSALTAEKAAQALKELEDSAMLDIDDVGLREAEEAVDGYDGSMSPVLMDEILGDDRELDIVDEEEDYDALVRFNLFSSSMFNPWLIAYFFCIFSLIIGDGFLKKVVRPRQKTFQNLLHEKSAVQETKMRTATTSKRTRRSLRKRLS